MWRNYKLVELGIITQVIIIYLGFLFVIWNYIIINIRKEYSYPYKSDQIMCIEERLVYNCMQKFLWNKYAKIYMDTCTMRTIPLSLGIW